MYINTTKALTGDEKTTFFHLHADFHSFTLKEFQHNIAHVIMLNVISKEFQRTKLMNSLFRIRRF